MTFQMTFHMTFQMTTQMNFQMTFHMTFHMTFQMTFQMTFKMIFKWSLSEWVSLWLSEQHLGWLSEVQSSQATKLWSSQVLKPFCCFQNPLNSSLTLKQQLISLVIILIASKCLESFYFCQWTSGHFRLIINFISTHGHVQLITSCNTCYLFI